MPANRSGINRASSFAELTKPLLGLPVSRPWRGYGTAIFLEIGELHEERYQTKSGERTSICGEYCIGVQWSWRVENPRSIQFGSFSTDRVITSRIHRLRDRTLKRFTIFGRIPELQIEMSDNLWLTSFMTSDGQPQWGIRLPTGWIGVERSRIMIKPIK
jgi:hypothetical protein